MPQSPGQDRRDCASVLNPARQSFYAVRSSNFEIPRYHPLHNCRLHADRPEEKSMPLFERTPAAGSSIDESTATFSINEIALAAGVPAEEAWRAVDLGQAVVYGKGLVSVEDAAHLVRLLSGIAPLDANRTPLGLKREPKGKGRFRLAAAGILYTLGAALLLLMSSMGLLSVTSTDQDITEPEQVRLVYLMSPGPGGGGGGGGLLAPLPPPPAQRKSPAPKKAASPVPTAKARAVPPISTPTPVPEVRVVQTVVETLKPTPAPAV